MSAYLQLQQQVNNYNQGLITDKQLQKAIEQSNIKNESKSYGVKFSIKKSAKLTTEREQ